jgi:hypothetical protein
VDIFQKNPLNMSIFKLFSRYSQTPSAPEEKSRPVASSKKSQEPDSDQRSEHSKARHLRRDQVFVAIREAMTRTGILPANYKFKVLSEDPQGNDFMVMMSLVVVAGEPLPPLGEMEASVMESALVRFQIIVSAVYWRITELAPAAKFIPPVTVGRTAAQPVPVTQPAPPGKLKSPHETIAADEVMAFQQALLAASAQGQTMPQEKSSLRPRFNQPKDFQDTEMVDSSVAPVLSKTQYGDL